MEPKCRGWRCTIQKGFVMYSFLSFYFIKLANKYMTSQFIYGKEGIGTQSAFGSMVNHLCLRISWTVLHCSGSRMSIFCSKLEKLFVSSHTWGEWAIAMHGRYESPVLLILFTHICYVHSMIFFHFSRQLVIVACLH
jgi:hypothetical protein